MIDRAAVQEWLDRYSNAWQTYDREAIGDLFSEDAEYRYHPLDEPVKGRQNIVRAWTDPNGDESGRDAPGTYEGRYEAYAVEGDRAVGVGRSTYWTDGTRSKLRALYDNVFLLEFDADGRCRSFTEVFLEREVD